MCSCDDSLLGGDGSDALPACGEKEFDAKGWGHRADGGCVSSGFVLSNGPDTGTEILNKFLVDVVVLSMEELVLEPDDALVLVPALAVPWLT